MSTTNNPRIKKLAVLTGGNGYIGRNLNRYLLGSGWDTVLLLRGDRQAIIPRYNGSGRCRTARYDGTKQSLNLLELNGDSNVVFFHLAAYTGFGQTLDSVDRLIDSNISFGTHLLDYMCRHEYKNFVFAESYWQFDEQGRLGGNNLYAVTKSAFSLLAQHYSKCIQTISLVLYDVYGPDDDRGKLANILINSAATQAPVDVTQGEQVLDYVYIDDVVRAFYVAGNTLLESVCEDSLRFRRATVRTLEARQLLEYVDIIGQVMGRLPNVRWGARPYSVDQIMVPWLPPASVQLPNWSPTVSFYSGVNKILT